MTQEELMDLVAKAQARFDALSLQEQDDYRYEQRRSFVRGQCPSKRDYVEWCKGVDKLLPPRVPR